MTARTIKPIVFPGPRSARRAQGTSAWAASALGYLADFFAAFAEAWALTRARNRPPNNRRND